MKKKPVAAPVSSHDFAGFLWEVVVEVLMAEHSESKEFLFRVVAIDVGTAISKTLEALKREGLQHQGEYFTFDQMQEVVVVSAKRGPMIDSV